MILSDRQIREAMVSGSIKIEPFDEHALGTNSYDVHLSETLMTHARTRQGVVDCKVEPRVVQHKIGPGGFVLHPNTLYLGSTVEYTETHNHVPFLDGKSSIGRLGITIHCTAGRGDVGFCNHWTLEIHVVEPVRVYAGMPIGQLIYFETGDVDVPYNKKPNAKYTERCAEPQPSQMWRNFRK